MSSCYSDDHIAEDYIHTDITTLNIEEPQQKNRLGTVSIKYREKYKCMRKCRNHDKVISCFSIQRNTVEDM